MRCKDWLELLVWIIGPPLALTLAVVAVQVAAQYLNL